MIGFWRKYGKEILLIGDAGRKQLSTPFNHSVVWSAPDHMLQDESSQLTANIITTIITTIMTATTIVTTTTTTTIIIIIITIMTTTTKNSIKFTNSIFIVTFVI